MTDTPYAVKTLNAQEGRVGGYLVVWGDTKTRDLQGEFFTPQTDFALDWFEVRPMLYQHGLDGEFKAAVIGRIDSLTADEIGIWAEAQLDTHKRYVRAVQRLIDRGILHWSSGSVGHLVEVTEDGQIKRWPLIEGSLTPTPAEPRRTDVAHIKTAYDSLGVELHPDCLENCTPNKMDMTRHVPTDETIKEDTPMSQPMKQLPLQSQADALPKISVSSEFDRFDASDMLHGYMLLRAGKSFQGVSERYANALSHKVNGAGLSAIKSDELAYSTQTGFGDEWVPELWSQQIWNKARQENTILPLFRTIEMPSNPFDLPIEGTDPTVYFVPETQHENQLVLNGSNNPIPDSKIGSGKVQLNAKKLALRVGFSSELVEDAIVPVLNIYREQAMRAIADSIDHVLLNGDDETGATGNINTDDGAANSTDRFLAFDGLRKLPLVTNTANRIDMGNVAPTLAKLREARFAMQTKYSARPSDLAWIVDGGTYAALLGLEEFLTMDKAGSLATAQTGQIGFLDGIPVFISAEMPLTMSDGKINTSTGTNDRGTAVCVYRPGWFIGYRRRIAVNVDYIPYYDSYQMTATVRLAFVNFNSDVASVLYNIGF
ncbi:MAG: phage major capsid protein [Chloroflexota bacterium]